MARHGSKVVRRRSCAGLLFGEFGTVLDSTVNGVIVQLLTALFYLFIFLHRLDLTLRWYVSVRILSPYSFDYMIGFYYEVVLLKPSAVCVA